MTSHQSMPRTLALFCKVIDNFGDIGICWRLARQLQHEHQLQVTLWVDDLVSFKRICPAVSTTQPLQTIEQVTIQHWQNVDSDALFSKTADIVIEFFGCDIPTRYINAMAHMTAQPVWLNIEGLSAEQWVEGCHLLTSPHPQNGLIKHFFYPGFTNKTGGLILEKSLLKQRQFFQESTLAKHAFLNALGLNDAEQNSFIISLFCYPNAPAQALFEVWKNSAFAITCLIPEGVVSQAVQQFTGQNLTANQRIQLGALTLKILPFVAQPDFDKLLWCCDLNMVRGEDSIVRSHWANRPFVWHIYPQENNLHHTKLNAFLDKCTATTPASRAFWHAWNEIGNPPQSWVDVWLNFYQDLPKIAALISEWQEIVTKNGDFASNLVAFSTACALENTKKE